MTSTQEFNCVFCKESFENKEDLQIHFRKHGDPNFNQIQKARARPSIEIQATSEKKVEEAEMVSCDVCTEVFPTISKAITHKHKIHPDHDAKYFCPWCGKLFTMKHLYNKHLQTSHENLERSDDINFHCDSCQVYFYAPSAMLYHNKFFHRQDTDLPSIGQSKKLKMVNQEVLQIYYCAFCGEEYDNKVNLHKHMTDDHGDENQSPEDVLRCPLCEAIFYHLDAYELHLTFHATEDLYTEKNEMFEQITEFSLETVPPLMEKVENIDPPEDAEIAMNAVGLDKFLEMAMGSSIDNDNNPKKSKKHKKHKKSKKSAITLDEFLNMNKDVFGEGIDVQGVEEVPTQVVAKRLKAKKFTKAPTGGMKMVGNTNIEKLKKQGIVVKMKQTKKPPTQNIKMGNKIPNSQVLKQNLPAKITQLKSSDEVLTKLLNQGNSQIKIVKKTATENTEVEQQLEKGATSDMENTFDKKCSSPENIEVECDVMQSGYTSSEADAKEDFVEKGKPRFQDDENNVNLKSPSNVGKHLPSAISDNQEESEEIKADKNNIPLCKEDSENVTESSSENSNNVQTLSNQITVKPIFFKTSGKSVSQAEDKSNANVKDAQDDSKNNIDNNIKLSEPSNITKTPYNALKHLSHLTVKPVTSKESCNVMNTVNSHNNDEEPNFTEPDNDSDIDENFQTSKSVNKEDSPRMQQVPEKLDTSLKSLDAFKNLSKNITIKSLTHSPKNNVDKNSEDDEGDSEISLKNKTDTKKFTGQHKSHVTMTTKNTLELNPHSPKHLPSQINSSGVKPVNQLIKKESDSNILEKVESKPNINILKHLTNITAKPVATASSNQQSFVSRSSSNVQNVMRRNVTETNKEASKEIEIFNIDDSDSDETDKCIPRETQMSDVKSVSKENTSFEKLKNISKNISVKPMNQTFNQNLKQIVKKTQKTEESYCSKSQGSMSDFSDDEDDHNTLTPNNGQNTSMQNLNIKNALKNLGKNITVKSRNSSPSAFVRLKDSNYSQDSKDYTNDTAESDNDSNPGKVKITELKDDNMSEDEITEPANKYNEYDGNVTVQSPGDSNSDFDNHVNEDTDGELSDLESQIQANTLKKPNQNASNQMLDFMNMNKNITIKSLNKGPGNSQIGSPSSSNNEVPNKILKSNRNDSANASVNKKKCPANMARPINQSVKQNVASNSQLSTVNKEVTVKTFQTKTVIQEITTTVTKTIKTVNQTVKQEVQSTSQSKQPVKYQKIQGMKPGPQSKNFQGVMVRHSAPTAGTKIRGSAPVRPTMVTPVRPTSNQLVPVRPFNPVRTNSPRMPAIRKVVPSTSNSQQIPMAGKPVKVSPKALNTTKRPNEEKTGHFSCFKKPKESLFPIAEMTNFDEDQSGESTIHFASQMSKSNFTSATKTVKGNTIVTQMKSEMSTSSQQLSKLNNLSGLKIMKTSQSKQAVQVEEQSEVSASKRNTLEAIEKLQKQGLLVKKPRLDVSDDNDQSDEDDHYLTEEPDD